MFALSDSQIAVEMLLSIKQNRVWIVSGKGKMGVGCS